MSEEKKKEVADNPALNDKLLKTRSVMLTGEISKESADQVIRQLLVLDSESTQPITMYINSPGGDVDGGFAIYDTVRFISSPVTMVGLGLVASAASLVLLAVPSERRVGLPNSSYLIHQPLSKMQGVTADVMIHANVIERLRTKLDSIIAEATGKTLEEVSKDTERDHWLFSDEALKYGLISKIINKKEELN
ncbi:MAG: ATP-dependent Clp protease proteolytic subunit [Spirochaetales bacterium]|uniref:ATP-dependent Clp protease proteolytic subunit n=1 Tax=Bullifex sp. TaxID=2815808 RepID=UPI002A56B879|nr:ATP-dependent Clp protease proteolytic subunit [Bullifex sp.]MDD5973584.1 ATP-dependent Clp protease proteolytic subunit [Spirochaetales bacterium]MDD7270618.1 ATP-dependent Clp protease proteolytic subunit [Spirochaetales bacterium]MDY4066193.1 ATP-dependent Clp protease proteolytic subunit [Bullifex sp.]